MYDVELNKMIELNYQKLLYDIKILCKRCGKRTRTPFGKITIIKTYGLSKLNYLIGKFTGYFPSGNK
jgi:hypothetical protein